MNQSNYLGGKFMRTTFMANANNIERKWYVVDAEGKTLGRLATEVATLLRGKHKPTYTPHVDTGDNVIIVNAEKIELTGKKLTDKIYYRHSQFPGGLKSRTALEMRTNYPEKMLELAIKGMLPKGSLGRQMFKKLHVYAGTEHPHQAQKPEVYELRG
jgi:large subunit ribosomal protein L13